MDSWIRITDRMPENCKVVLLFNEDFGIITGHWNSGASTETPWWVQNDWVSGVTHWMPLPAEPTDQ